MKITKTARIQFLKNKLATDARWALRALVVVFNHQTADEQASDCTHDHNGIGFTGVDAEILSSFAKQYLRRGSLSEKQMPILFRKMPRYAGQLLAVSDAAKFEAALAASAFSTQN